MARESEQYGGFFVGDAGLEGHSYLSRYLEGATHARHSDSAPP